MKRAYQVWTYRECFVTPRGPKPIPHTLLFGGQEFATKRAADAAWYDTMPGRNDHHVVVRKEARNG